MENLVVWKDEYSVKVKEIDDQHKKLVNIINKLHGSMVDNKTKDELSNILKELLDYGVIHFDTEEKYFSMFNYEDSENHIKEHDLFKAKATELYEKCGNNEMEISFELIDFLEDWLLDHLVNVDQKYVECFQRNNLK